MNFLIFRKPISGQRMRFIGYRVYHNMSRFCCEKKLSYFSSFVPDNVDWSDYLDRNYLNKSQFVNYKKKKTSKPLNEWCESPENQNARVVESVPTTENQTDNSVVKIAQISRQLSSLLMIALRQWMTVGPKCSTA